ncbi:CAF17-like 4Fe-4S cluster assembly/insertion protein YgfZ [Marilutibacter aestuarii]
MNDVGVLADGQWQWNGWLTPKGRVIALFALVRLDAQTLWLLLPDADAADLCEHLRRFLFRSKLMLDVAGDLSVSGRFQAPASARGAHAARLPDGGLELDMGGDGGPRTLRVGPVAGAAGDATAAWRDADLAHGLPRLDASQSGQWTPQQLSLERLRAFSVKKGCYPGQEIVARTHFLGKAKRGLAGYRAGTAVAVGAAVGDGERETGTVVSVSSDGLTCLAVVPLDGGPAPRVRVGTLELEPLPLRDGLGR